MSRHLKFVKNLSWISVGQFSSKVLVFLLLPLYTTYLSTTDYGIFDIILTITLLISPILTLQMTEPVVRFSLEKNSNPIQILAVALFVLIIGSTILILIFPAVRMFIDVEDLYYWFFVFFVLRNLHMLLNQFLKGTNQIKLYAVLGIVSTLITIILNIVFLVVFNMKLNGFLLANILGHFLIILTIFVLAIKNIKGLLNSVIFFNKDLLVRMSQYSIPMIPNALSWWVINASDKIILTFILGPAVVGVYAVGYKLPSILSIIMGMIMSAWYIASVEDFGSDGNRKLFSDTINLILSCNLVIASLIVFFIKNIAELLFQKGFYEAWTVVPILILGYLFFSLAVFLESIYTSSYSTKKLFLSTVSAATLNLLLNFLLIPFFSTIGAALATSLSFIILFVLRYLGSKKIYSFYIPMSRFIISIGIVTLLIIATYISDFVVIRVVLFLFVFCWNLLHIYKNYYVQSLVFGRKEI